LSQCSTLLEVLIPGKALSVASRGRRTQAAGDKAGALLAVFDAYARPRVRAGGADEIYVRDPALMGGEQESLGWVWGRLREEGSGEAWSQEFARLPNLEPVARDGGTGLAKGVALVNAQRQEQGQEPIVDQGDPCHALWRGGVGLPKAEKRARQALAAAAAAPKALEECARPGQAQTGPAVRASHAWKKAAKAMAAWQETERVWQQTKDALPLIPPDGELNTRVKAKAVLAETLPQLPDSDFAKTKRHWQRPEMLNYLDRVQDKLAKVPFPQEVTQAAVRQEALRRRPEVLPGETPKAAAWRGVMLV
jgi:hypothetical protein